jgi:hypothetical protein
MGLSYFPVPQWAHVTKTSTRAITSAGAPAPPSWQTQVIPTSALAGFGEIPNRR